MRTPHALFALAALAACTTPPPEATPFNLTVDSLVAESMRDGRVPGMAITIVRNDSVIHSRGYGFADLERQVVMTDSTPVVIGSTSKTFTAFALMHLVDDGAMALDSSIARYVGLLGAGGRPATVPADSRFSRITPRQLLTNSAGLPVGFSGDPYGDGIDTTAGALERLVRDDMLPRRLDYAPGEGFRYSNRGFSLASLIVQDVTGISYEEFIDGQIFQPLGMRHSTGEFWRGTAMGRATGYREGVDGLPVPRPPATSREWTGSGMITSSAADVGRYLRAILNDGRTADGRRVLSPEAVAELLRPQVKGESELGGPTTYALGWEVNDVGGVPVVMKGGSVVSMGSLFLMLPKQRLGVAMVFNLVDYGKVQLMQNLLKVLLGAPTAPYQVAPAPPVVPPTGKRITASRLSELSGAYMTRTGLLTVVARGDSLLARYEANDVRLEPASDSSFIVRSNLREQEGTPMAFRRCGSTICLWISGDSSGVRQ